MEAVNNYFSGSVRSVPWTTGTSGFGQNTDLLSTGGVPFSSLLQGSNTVKGKDSYDVKKPVTNQDKPGNSSRSDNSGKTPKSPNGGQNTVSPDSSADAAVNDTEEVKNGNADDMTAMLLLMSNLQADRITTASNGVELVTEKITTEAAPPATDVSGVINTGDAPTVSTSNLVPTALGESVSGTNVKSESSAAALEEERNGTANIDGKKVEETVTGKYDPAEILKSLEGQGRIVSNSTNSPTGTPSMDTNGPTGRAPDNQINRTEMEMGPVAPKQQETKASTDSSEKDPMEGFTEIHGSTPSPFANQTNQASANTQTTASNETMMMRTAESTLASDLTNLLSSRFPTQNGQLTIELDPENLGKITINVSYDSGHAQVSISATNQKTVEILTQSAPAMANIIQQKTGQETQVYIPNAQQSSAKQDMASGRESNENAAQQQARQQAQHGQQSAESSIAFLQQMRLGLV
ncbi:flagellar hook-length control protein [Lachnospiraceae bacterium JC7]|nr:flagellar hook-length control protein [Lachnospiraceae bacterium JC7]